ncbi:hypothetical protein HDIA_1029 [Hartmannibacter diazotrophicus]|uniref:Uncharacterized protein n=1 Tax=Hartmannibacter diazotrophicus TaxID=1482074 RepID=A0A2C9D2T2_9HYPH|nr:hypothetical protein [Hartmannibacter diazotrophicus]SON54570.1 hypothetical protein HDIA_1029 [Hartmannibacter diazotrophicus]
MALPCSESKAGHAREKEIYDTLRSAGARAVGFMVDDEAESNLCEFKLGGSSISVPIAIADYEKAWLKENPQSSRSHSSLNEHRAKARELKERAAWAVMAASIRAQIAMIANRSVTYR